MEQVTHHTLSQALIRKVDEATTIIEHPFVRHNVSCDCVFAELDGYHGRFVNVANGKVYFVTGGIVEFEVEGETTVVGANEIFCLPPGLAHSINGHKARMLVWCTPPFDPKNEQPAPQL